VSGAPEVLTWASGDPASGRPGEDEQVGTWVDLGELDGTPAVPPPPPPEVRRVPRAVLWAAAALAVGALATTAFGDSSGSTRATPSATVPDGGDSTGGPTFTVPPLPHSLTLPDQVALAAHSKAWLHNSVRTGGSKGECPVRQKHAPDPVRAATRVVTTILPGFTLLDSGQTRDRFGGVCLVQLRATNTDGSILVLTVVPPGTWPGVHNQELVSLQSRQQGSSLTRTVSDLTATGWRIDVGAVGEASVVPDLGRLGAVADNNALEW
jgi:hypothetical protein